MSVTYIYIYILIATALFLYRHSGKTLGNKINKTYESRNDLSAYYDNIIYNAIQYKIK